MVVVDGLFISNSYLLTGKDFQNLLLWKPRVGEAYTVCNAERKFFRARVTKLKSDKAEIFVFEGPCESVESDLTITLLHAIPEKERMELIIQKVTELGVSSIIPFKSKCSISIEERDAKQKKSHKWGEIALKASKQCRRASIPQVHPYCNFANAVHATAQCDLKILLWENEKDTNLKKTILNVKDLGLNNIAIMIGSEGGFEDTEITRAREAGFITVGIGHRILRTETAAIVTVGLIQYELGNLG